LVEARCYASNLLARKVEDFVDKEAI
jgi:hypothetical protein